MYINDTSIYYMYMNDASIYHMYSHKYIITLCTQ